jgi:hypothetical protein
VHAVEQIGKNSLERGGSLLFVVWEVIESKVLMLKYRPSSREARQENGVLVKLLLKKYQIHVCWREVKFNGFAPVRGDQGDECFTKQRVETGGLTEGVKFRREREEQVVASLGWTVEEMVLFFGGTTTVVWTPSHRGLTIAVHPGLKGKKVIDPLDEEEALRERELCRNCSELLPINGVKLGVYPVVSALEGSTLSLFADESSNRARKLSIDCDVVNCDGNLAGLKELHVWRGGSMGQGNGGEAVTFNVEDGFAWEGRSIRVLWQGGGWYPESEAPHPCQNEGSGVGRVGEDRRLS